MNPTPDMNNYVLAQLQAGLTPEDITGQLRAAGWPDTAIQAAFSAARQQLIPAPVAMTPEPTPTVDTPVTLPNEPQPVQQVQQLPQPIKRGRLKTGWLLFKQSLRVIKDNPGLSRYVIMSMAWSLGIFAVVVTIAIFDATHAQTFFHEAIDSTGKSSYTATLPGLLLLAVSGFLATFATYYYGVALSSHVLAIFRGTPSDYKQHIALARTKLTAIAMYALIATVVGYLLRLLEERFKLVGFIISRILGALWALATSFVLPIIADSNESGPKAIKHSVSLFKANWGETIVSRISLVGLIVLLYVVVGLPLFILLAVVLGSTIGIVGIIITLALYLIGMIVLAVLNTLASNILNVCLYYYAQYKVIPPAFSPELLASVFIEKKKKK
jgi:hypothetical protein